MDAAMVKSIADLLGAVAWPAVVGLSLYAFRSELRRVIANLRWLKWGDKEAKFEEGAVRASKAIEAAVEQQPTLPAAQPEESSPSPETELEGIDEAGIRNSAIVMTEWKHVEAAIGKLAKEYGMNDTRRIAWSLDTLDRKGALPKSLLKGIRELYQLRNQVAHTDTFEPDGNSTAVYIASAREARTVLKQLTLQSRATK